MTPTAMDVLGRGTYPRCSGGLDRCAGGGQAECKIAPRQASCKASGGLAAGKPQRSGSQSGAKNLLPKSGV